MILREILKASYETIVAVNGREAVDMAAIHQPDLILMDILMPEMDGLQATRLIRHNPGTISIPMLTVTARVSFKDKEKVRQSGSNDFLAKPFTYEQLIDRIERLLNPHGDSQTKKPSYLSLVYSAGTNKMKKKA